MDDLSKYVPVHVASKRVTVEGKTYSVDDHKMSHTLITKLLTHMVHGHTTDFP